MSKIAFITGITGQDGFYLSKLLLQKNYQVHGLCRRTSLPNSLRLESLKPSFGKQLFLHNGDLVDFGSLLNLIKRIHPHEIYNLAAQSDVAVSFSSPKATAEVNALGTLNLLEVIRILGLTKFTKFYQASSSELFGKVTEIPQNEQTSFYPRSPYAVSKLFAYWSVVNYREAFDCFACNGILFNHESPLRGENFVTRKITKALGRIFVGMQECLYIGNLSAKRDWSHAEDVVEMQWKILQQERPDDYVIASGKTRSVREFISIAAEFLGLEISWEGEGLNETGFIKSIKNPNEFLYVGKKIIEVDASFFRPAEVDVLLGDPGKAKKVLQWNPRYSFESLVKDMVDSDLKLAIKETHNKQFDETRTTSLLRS